ncbi:hypothetical protein ZIOFF_000618 [Zingiber officinale]|uniref:Uncharacterized protein n=1 Tax=Zingiber officinale TaxID=94328 RepID=A0A8J5I0G3_ZINOF|nr:hypothetical protein ZIOFF_000618 [Zingiber officinale]
MLLMLSAVSKMKGCIRQIEHLNPSGASEQDILTRAKMLFAEDPKYTKGFKFDHVWNILKNIEKFGTDTMNTAFMKSRQQNANDGSFEQQFFEEAFHTPSSPVKMVANAGGPPRGSAAAAASLRRRRTAGGGGAAAGGGASTMLQFYTDDAAGARMSPNTVLFMSIGFIAVVALLHVFGKLYIRH